MLRKKIDFSLVSKYLYRMSEKRGTEVIKLLIASRHEQYFHIQKILKEEGLMNEEILQYRNNAISLWKEMATDFHQLEKEFAIPFELHERPHLYAIDSLVLAHLLKVSKADTKVFAKIYILFFMLVSIFDDHVEHRDKVYSKYSFNNTSDRSTQHGAIPFSFVSMVLNLITKYMESAKVSPAQQLKIIKTINKNILSYAYCFTMERDNLGIEKVFEMKQRQVSGKVIAVMADLIEPFVSLDKSTMQVIRDSLFYIGSMMQITDDIRDAEADMILNNANLLNTCLTELGLEKGGERFAELFENEYTLARRSLENFFDEMQISLLLSLPFYPFCIEVKE